MSNSKQDRQGARTPADLERRYNFGKTFEEVYGIANSAKETASEATVSVDKLDNSLNQEEIFKRLTKNGEVQGVFMEDGEIYFNGSYIKSGKISADVIDVDNLRPIQIVGTTGTDVITVGYSENRGYGLEYKKDGELSFGIYPQTGNPVLVFYSEGVESSICYQGQNGFIFDVNDTSGNISAAIFGAKHLLFPGLITSDDGFTVSCVGRNNYIVCIDDQFHFFINDALCGYIDADGWHGRIYAEDLQGLVAQSQYFQRSDGASPTQAELIEMIKAKAVELAQQNIPLKFPFTWHGKEYGFAEVFKYTNNHHHLTIFTASIGTKKYVGSGNGASWKEVT